MHDPALAYEVAMLLVGALILLVAISVDHHMELKRRQRAAWWKKKRDGGGDAS